MQCVLIRALGRADVLPVTDKFVFEYLAALPDSPVVGKKGMEKEDVEAVKQLTASWAPYRSMAALLIWHSKISA